MGKKLKTTIGLTVAYGAAVAYSAVIHTGVSDSLTKNTDTRSKHAINQQYGLLETSENEQLSDLARRMESASRDIARVDNIMNLAMNGSVLTSFALYHYDSRGLELSKPVSQKFYPLPYHDDYRLKLVFDDTLESGDDPAILTITGKKGRYDSTLQLNRTYDDTMLAENVRSLLSEIVKIQQYNTTHNAGISLAGTYVPNQDIPENVAPVKKLIPGDLKP